MSNRYRKTIFGDLPFIEFIIADFNKLRLADELSEDEMDSARKWYHFITKNSDLVIDIDINDFTKYADSNPLIKQLLKSCTSGGSEVIPVKKSEEFDREQRYLDFPNAVFLLDCDSDECKSNGDKYGMIFLNRERYKSFTEKLFFLTYFQVRENTAHNDLKTWFDLKKISHPMNSLIIADNYVLRTESEISDNLIPLLDAILPVHLEKTSFQLLIISSQLEEKLLDKFYSFLTKQIRERLKRPYVIELSIITALISKNHDRHMFTNYFMFSSGNSFNYFNRKGETKVNTYLEASPAFLEVSGGDLMYKKILSALSDIKALLEKHTIKKKGVQMAETHRLLKLVPRI